MPIAAFVALAFVLLFIVVPLVIGAIMLLATLMFLLVLACAIGLPFYILAKRWMSRQGLLRPAQQPLDRLKTLYVEGKIDLFEFERRAAALLHVENF